MKPTVVGVNRNLWRTRPHTLSRVASLVDRRNFPIDGLVFYAPLWHPELSGSPFLSKDLVSHTCTVYGAVWGIQGRLFDGVDDRVVSAINNTVFKPTTFTIEAWIKTGVVAAGTRIILTTQNAANSGISLNINQPDAGKAIGYLRGAAAWFNTGDSGAFLTTTEYWHLVITYDLQNFILYVNGTYKMGTAVTDAITHSADARVYIGEGYDGLFDYTGFIGEVRIYNRALTTSEILHNYQATKWRYL